MFGPWFEHRVYGMPEMLINLALWLPAFAFALVGLCAALVLKGPGKRWWVTAWAVGLLLMLVRVLVWTWAGNSRDFRFWTELDEHGMTLGEKLPWLLYADWLILIVLLQGGILAVRKAKAARA